MCTLQAPLGSESEARALKAAGSSLAQQAVQAPPCPGPTPSLLDKGREALRREPGLLQELLSIHAPHQPGLGQELGERSCRGQRERPVPSHAQLAGGEGSCAGVDLRPLQSEDTPVPYTHTPRHTHAHT